MKFSLIAPTFGRPEEVTEFLESLLKQEYDDFEVIISDGTPGDTLRPELQRFLGNSTYPLTIHYEEFLPVSDARNDGARIARGEYLIFLDSDCIIPPDYLKKVEKGLQETGFEVFGGPDAAHKDFTHLQKAISYSMTSLFTTGGIRGGKKRVGVFHPRGFNMGVHRKAFESVGGYSSFRCGEDIELSIRLIKAGFKTGLIPEAYVFHKRRTSLKQFYRQVFRFGAARINIWKRHPEELKLTHLFPSAFVLFTLLSIALVFTGIPYRFLPIQLVGIYLFLIMVDSTIRNKSLLVGDLSVLTSLTMMFGYGIGFLKNAWAVIIKGQPLKL